MSWISDDYVCEDPLCTKYGEVVEKLGKREERDTYICDGWIPSECPPIYVMPPWRYERDKETGEYRRTCCRRLTRQLSAPRTKHVSWGTWKI
jgi:hypothetical protein